MKTVFLSLFFILSANYCSSQNKLRLELTDKIPDYLSISEVIVSPPVFYENIIDEFNAGHKHRIIIIVSGIYSSVYIDMISLNVEGGVNKQNWSRKIELRKLYEEYSLNEETDHMDKLKWLDDSSFTFKLSDLKFVGYIVEEGNALQVMNLRE